MDALNQQSLGVGMNRPRHSKKPPESGLVTSQIFQLRPSSSSSSTRLELRCSHSMQLNCTVWEGLDQNGPQASEWYRNRQLERKGSDFVAWEVFILMILNDFRNPHDLCVYPFESFALMIMITRQPASRSPRYLKHHSVIYIQFNSLTCSAIYPCKELHNHLQRQTSIIKPQCRSIAESIASYVIWIMEMSVVTCCDTTCSMRSCVFALYFDFIALYVRLTK